MKFAHLWCKIVGHDRIIVQVDVYQCRRCGEYEILHEITALRDVITRHYREELYNGRTEPGQR